MTGTRSALIVANDRYQDPGLRRLRAPGQDAQALVGVLGDQGIGAFQVRTVTNETEHRLRREIAAFFANRKRDDLLLAHFSCHGVKDDSGQLYFATADTELDNLDATAVPADFVNRHMNRSLSRRVVLLLDCCYSGAFARGLMARADTSVDLKERFEGRGRTVLTASSAMEYAFEDAELAAGRGQPSVFTRALVQGLETGDADRDGDGYVSVDELYHYVSEQVARTASKQTPGRWDFDMQGDLVIARTPRPRAVPLPPALRQALEHPFAGVRLGAVEELERLLRGSHAGFALAAEAALQELARDDSQRVSVAAAAALAATGRQPAAGPAGPAAGPSPARDPAPVERPGPTEPPDPDRHPARDGGGPRTAAAPPRPVAAPPRPVVARPKPPRRPPPVRAATPAGPPRRPGRPLADRRRLLLLLACLVLLVAGLPAALRWSHRPEQVGAGQRFDAVSPWHLKVEGGSCAATVSSSDGTVTSSGHGAKYLLQMRASGSFVLTDLTPGCTAVVTEGAGSLARLPFTVEQGGEGAGGDTAPFVSPGSFKVEVSGGGYCRTQIHRASDGMQVDELSGSATSEINQPGEFYLHLDERCGVTVSPL